MPVTVLVDVNAGAPVQVALLGPKTEKVMVPVGLDPPERVAVSEIAPPSVTGGEAAVTMAGLALVGVVTVTLSLAAPQALVTGPLLASPLYAAIQLYVPGVVTVNAPEGYTPLPATGTVEVKMAAPVHVGLPGPKKVKVMVPVGLTPLERVAVSETDPPAGTDGDGAVTMDGLALATTTLSLAAPQALVTAALLASPL